MNGDAWLVHAAERMAQRRVQQIPYAHLSVELGHLSTEEFAEGPDKLECYFERIAPWVETATRMLARTVPSRLPRVSTCFLVDDYYTRFSTPAVVLPQLLKASEDHGITIDYLARASGCVEADGKPLAELVRSRLVADPAPGSTGVRPPATESGWLCNGERTPDIMTGPAMSGPREWRPPAQNAASSHSIFVDVELWGEQGGRRIYSRPYLAAVWQLLRLGLLRQDGAAVTSPVAVNHFPEDWDHLPPIVQANPKAKPFSAYSTFSVLEQRFLPVEHAVRIILEQISVDPVAAQQMRVRSLAEQMSLPEEPTERIEYLLLADAR